MELQQGKIRSSCRRVVVVDLLFIALYFFHYGIDRKKLVHESRMTVFRIDLQFAFIKSYLLRNIWACSFHPLQCLRQMKWSSRLPLKLSFRSQRRIYPLKIWALVSVFVVALTQLGNLFGASNRCEFKPTDNLFLGINLNLTHFSTSAFAEAESHLFSTGNVAFAVYGTRETFMEFSYNIARAMSKNPERSITEDARVYNVESYDEEVIQTIINDRPPSSFYVPCRIINFLNSSKLSHTFRIHLKAILDQGYNPACRRFCCGKLIFLFLFSPVDIDAIEDGKIVKQPEEILLHLKIRKLKIFSSRVEHLLHPIVL